MLNTFLKFMVSLSCPLLVGFVASRFSVEAAPVYASFVLPPLSPPGYVFGIAWTILYIMMGISCFLIWNSPHKQKRTPLLLYCVQLGVNFFWTFFFFNFDWKLFSFFWILFLIGLLYMCMREFLPISKIAFWLLIPYMAWLLFASYLNLGIYLLN